MDDLFNVSNLYAVAIAPIAEGQVAFSWTTTALFLLALAASYSVPLYLGYWASRQHDGRIAETVTSFLFQLSVFTELLAPLVIFYVLTGRFFGEYLVLIVAAMAAGLLFQVIAQTAIGAREPEKQQKFHAFIMAHTSQGVSILSSGLWIINILTLVVCAYLALVTSFRIDLEPEAIQARIAIFLFAVPTVASFIWLLPANTYIIQNRFLDGETRAQALMNLFSRTVITSLFLVFPSVMFGEEAHAYLPILPRVDDLIWLPAALFGVFGVLPFLFSSLNRMAFLRNREAWRRDWLSGFPAAFRNENALDLQQKALENEIKRMLGCSPYFENYLYRLMEDRYGKDSDQFKALFRRFDMQSRAVDGVQLSTINDHRADLSRWEPITAYIEDLFRYLVSFEEHTISEAEAATWTARMERGRSTNLLGSAIPAALGTLITGALGVLLERLIDWMLGGA